MSKLELKGDAISSWGSRLKTCGAARHSRESQHFKRLPGFLCQVSA